MKKILVFIFILCGFSSFATNYYISPSGNDASGSGTIGSPWWSMRKPYDLANPGDTIFMRGGTYAYTNQSQCYLVGRNGSSGNLIVIMSYPGEQAIITKGSGYTNNNVHWRGGVFLSANYVKMYRLEFTGFEHGTDPVTGFIWRGLYMENANFCVIEWCQSHDNEYGFNLQDNSKGNLFLNCDAWNNWDINTGGGNADGFGWGYLTVNDPANPNVARGCRSRWNGDDGFDGWHGEQIGGIVVLDSCWSWFNGYYKGTFTPAGNGEGFKAGGGDGGSSGVMMRYYKNCISYHNDNKGFEQNNLKGNVTLYNCIAVDNNNHGINLNENGSVHVIKNCLSIGNNGSQFFLNSESIAVSSNNSSSDGTSSTTNNLTSGDFTDYDISTSHGDAQLWAARKSDGSLPDITFLHLDSGSDLIDAGIFVGIAYNGSAPDRGPFEFGTATNNPPSADAGSDQSITLPINSVSLSGNGSDVDGTIASYAWSKISGPATYTITSPSSQNTTVTGLVQGTYVFRLTVTDDDGATGTDDVQVVVNPAIVPSGESKIILRFILKN